MFAECELQRDRLYQIQRYHDCVPPPSEHSYGRSPVCSGSLSAGLQVGRQIPLHDRLQRLAVESVTWKSTEESRAALAEDVPIYCGALVQPKLDM